MPEQFFSSLHAKIKKEWVFAFCSALLIGLITHLFVFTNRLPNHDGLLNLYNTQAKVKSGRFFLGPASGISSYFDLPWVIGVVSLLFLALTTVAIVMLFAFKKNTTIFLTAGIVVTFPSVSATFSYLFTADGYIFGMFLSIVAIILGIKGRFGFVLGGVVLTLAIGIYQADLSIFLAYAAIWLLYQMLVVGISNQLLFKRIGQLFLTTTIGMGLYYLVFKLYTSLLDGFITEYQGLDKVGSVTPTDLPQRLIQMFNQLKLFFIPSYVNQVDFTLYDGIHLLLIGFVLVFTAYYMIQKKFYFNWVQFILFFGIVGLLPFIYFIVYFLSPDAFYHMLMLFSMSTFYIYLLALYEGLPSQNARFSDKAFSWGLVSILLIMIWNFNVIANISYFNMEMRTEKSLALSNRILDRMEQLDDYDTIEKVAVSGRVKMSSELSGITIPSRTPAMIGSTGEMIMLDSYHYKVLLEDFLGKQIEAASPEELAQIQTTTSYKEMPLWPAKGSVQVIDSIVVIKFIE